MTGTESLFRKSSLERISSPDQLNDYIRVSNPSIWLLIGALITMLAAVAVWSIWGSLPTQISATGATLDGSIICYLDPSETGAIKSGQEVRVRPAGSSSYSTAASVGIVKSVSSQPLTRDQVAAELKNDYLLQSMAVPDYSVRVSITPGESVPAQGSIVNLGIVIDEVRPIDFLIE